MAVVRSARDCQRSKHLRLRQRKQSKRDSKRDPRWTTGSFLQGKSEGALGWLDEKTRQERLLVQHKTQSSGARQPGLESQLSLSLTV